jgi:hypothetical protein
MLKELPNRFELDPNALEIGDRFFCIDRSFIGRPRLVEFVVEKISNKSFECKSLVPGERDIRFIKNNHCFIYGPESEAVRCVKMEITVSNLVREIQTKGLEAMTPKLEEALTEWESARTKYQGPVKKTKDLGRQ